MKLSIIALAIVTSCRPALAGSSDSGERFCHAGATLALHGAEDGLIGASILDGLDEAITFANAGGNDLAERLAMSSYLTGYSQGLLQDMEPAAIADQFYFGCLSWFGEPV